MNKPPAALFAASSSSQHYGATFDGQTLRIPGAQILVYDNYNALAIGFGPSDKAGQAILSLAVMPRWVTLCFLWGKGLADPHGLLKGEGSRVQIDVPARLAYGDPAAPGRPSGDLRFIVDVLAAR